MKKLLIAGLLTAVSLSAFAQIDDVINKPKVEKPKTPSLTESTFLTLFNRFQEISVESLVQEMKADGVTERKFGAVIGVQGRIFDVAIWDDETKGHMLPFLIKLTTDKKVLVTASIVDFGNPFEKTVGTDSWLPFTKLQAAVFVLDDGVSFRDIKNIGWRLGSVEGKIPVVNRSSDSYIAIVLGAEGGGSAESIVLDDGQMLNIRGLKDDDDYTDNHLGIQFNSLAGLELKDEMLSGIITLKGLLKYNNLYGYNAETMENVTHTNMIINPEISYTRKLGKKSSVTVNAGMNINAFNKVNTKEENDDYIMETVNTIDLGQRSRQPFKAGVKINF